MLVGSSIYQIIWQQAAGKNSSALAIWMEANRCVSAAQRWLRGHTFLRLWYTLTNELDCFEWITCLFLVNYGRIRDDRSALGVMIYRIQICCFSALVCDFIGVLFYAHSDIPRIVNNLRSEQQRLGQTNEEFLMNVKCITKSGINLAMDFCLDRMDWEAQASNHIFIKVSNCEKDEYREPCRRPLWNPLKWHAKTIRRRTLRSKCPWRGTCCVVSSLWKESVWAFSNGIGFSQTLRNNSLRDALKNLVRDAGWADRSKCARFMAICCFSVSG